MEFSWTGHVLEAAYWADYYWRMAEDENKEEFMELIGKVPDSESETEAVRAGAANLKVTELLRSRDIIQAIELGRGNEVEARLKQGVDHVNSVFLCKRKPKKRPLLHYAVAFKKTRIVELLLRHKADVTVSGNVQILYLFSTLIRIG